MLEFPQSLYTEFDVMRFLTTLFNLLKVLHAWDADYLKNLIYLLI